MINLNVIGFNSVQKSQHINNKKIDFSAKKINSSDTFSRSNQKVSFGSNPAVELSIRAANLLESAKGVFAEKQIALISAMKDNSGLFNENRVNLAEKLIGILSTNPKVKAKNDGVQLSFVMKQLANQDGDINKESVDLIGEIFSKEKNPSFHIMSMIFSRLLKDEKGNISTQGLESFKLGKGV